MKTVQTPTTDILFDVNNNDCYLDLEFVYVIVI
jgi:hypothetical protein